MKAAQLVTWRHVNKLSQPEAARLLGKSEKTLRRYEKGESPIPATVATATVALSTPASDVAVAPPFAKGETPWTHPHLFKRAPGKKHRWERIMPGEPLADPEVYREAMAALEAIEAAKPPPLNTMDWDDDVDGEHDPED